MAVLRRQSLNPIEVVVRDMLELIVRGMVVGNANVVPEHPLPLMFKREHCRCAG